MGSGFGIDFLRIDGDGTGFNGIDGGGTEEINFGLVSICLFLVLPSTNQSIIFWANERRAFKTDLRVFVVSLSKDRSLKLVRLSGSSSVAGGFNGALSLAI